MDDFADLLKYIVPLVIFIGAAIFGKSNKQKEQPKNAATSAFGAIMDLLDDTVETKPKREEPEYKYRSAADVIPKPDMSKKKKKANAAPMPEEGERAIVVGEPTIAEPEAEPEKISFDAREAVIYSTILERKY